MLSRPLLMFRDQRGNVAVLFGLALLPIVASVGAALDYTRASREQAKLQALVDRAAIMAASQTDLSSGQVTTAVQSFLSPPPANDQRSTDGTAAARPTLDATVSTAEQSVSVAAQKSVPTSVMQVFGVDAMPLRASAKAARIETGPPICVLALNATASDALSFGGNTTFRAQGCAVQSNSSAANALTVQGSATVEAGGYCSSGGVSVPSTLLPKPKTNCPRRRDPFATLPEPVAGNCVGSDNKVYQVGSNKTDALRPGTYCGLDINGTANLEPGTYVIKNASLSISAQAAVKGSGVTFYLVGSGGSFTINGGSALELSAPTSGVYKGILIAQDRTTGTGNKLNGNASSKLMGVIYTPVRSLTVNGDGGFGASNPFMPVVADTIKFSGNSVTQADQTVMRPAEPLPSFSIGARLAN